MTDIDIKTTLVATLGGKSQLVTFLLDLLLANRETIDQVIVIYIAPYPRSQTAFKRLESEFAGNIYEGRPCHFRGVQIQTNGDNLQDIRTPEEVEVVRQNIHSLLSELKEQGQRIHLGLSGGRRLISLIALAAAAQYLTPADRIWHIHIPPESLELTHAENILHAPPEAGVRLIAVPFVPWVAYFPGLAPLMAHSPEWNWLDNVNRQRCATVWGTLTGRQREVLQAFADGLSRQRIAEKLNISASTVDSHRERILAQCSLVWEAQAGEEFDTRFIQKYFGPFMAGYKHNSSVIVNTPNFS